MFVGQRKGKKRRREGRILNSFELEKKTIECQKHLIRTWLTKLLKANDETFLGIHLARAFENSFRSEMIFCLRSSDEFFRRRLSF